MLDRDEQDLRNEITTLRDSVLHNRSLSPVADAMQVALNAVLNPPAPEVAPEPVAPEPDPGVSS